MLLGSKGVQFQIGYSGEVFANLSGSAARGADVEGLLTLSVNLDLEKLIHWQGATLYASMLYPHGDGITGEYVHDYNVLSSIDAYDSPRLFELWLQQAFCGGSFTLRAGELTTDNDFGVSSNGALFINSIFGILGPMDHNVDLPTYPVTSEGIRAYAQLTPVTWLQAIAVDDNPGLQNTSDQHGARFGFDRGHGVLTFLEAGYSPIPACNAQATRATYKLGGYYDSQFHPDVSASSTAHGDYGFYAIADQPLYTPGSTQANPSGLSGFARFGIAPDQRNPVVYYFDTGFNEIGLFPGRPKDTLGAAFSFERLGTDVDLADGAPVLSHHEHVIELTYLAILNDRLSLQPDLQYIINPGGFTRAQNAFVAGMRVNVTF